MYLYYTAKGVQLQVKNYFFSDIFCFSMPCVLLPIRSQKEKDNRRLSLTFVFVLLSVFSLAPSGISEKPRRYT